MKKMFLTLIIALASLLNLQAMSTSNIRTHARFISDRMAYELDMSPWQYEECYEINYDFIRAIDRVMDDVVYGYYDAIDTYYRLLDERNDDLRYVLTSTQYRRFMACEYFYRPVYTTGRRWEFRIYTTYSNKSFFYYDAPTIYRTYRGDHDRTHYSNGYYSTRRVPTGRPHEVYQGNDHRFLGSHRRQEYDRNDFGANRVQRPACNQKPQRDNYYSNGNQKNRDRDTRYHDNSGNTQSPQINHPQQQPSNSVRGDHPGQPQQSGTPTSHRR